MTQETEHKPIPMEVLDRTARVLRVLAHPHRLKIIELLADRKLTVGEVADAVGIAPNACSQHMNMMKAHGLLTSRREGRTILYQADNPDARNVINCIRKYHCTGP